jgi:hypothetical protein
MSPDEVYDCTPWEFAASVEGWNELHAGPTVEPPTAQEFRAMRGEVDG